MTNMQFFHFYMVKYKDFIYVCRKNGGKKILRSCVEFQDRLQLIPHNWLNNDLSKAAWPNFTNNKRYDRAVKLMDQNQRGKNTQLKKYTEHPVRNPLF